MRGFAWWAPHDRAHRAAVFLLAAVATICAAYLAAAVFAVAVAIRVGKLGPWRGLAKLQHRLGPLGLIGAAVAVVIAAAALIAFLAWEGLARRALRLSHSRPPATGEADHAERTIEAIALGVGYSTPRLRIVDDAAPNGFAAGRRRACAVCLTSGALSLPYDELDALCEHAVTSVSNRATPLACAAADLVLIANWCTKAIWAISALILVSSVVGVPADLVAMTTLAIVLLVVATKPLLALADRAIVRLLDDAARLADLDTVRVTNRPAALARLLLTTSADQQTVASRWQIAHLWFDPDTRPRPRDWRSSLPRRLQPLFADSSSHSLAPDVVMHRRTQARQSLIERARVIVDLTDGDPELREQLARLERG